MIGIPTDNLFVTSGALAWRIARFIFWIIGVSLDDLCKIDFTAKGPLNRVSVRCKSIRIDLEIPLCGMPQFLSKINIVIRSASAKMPSKDQELCSPENPIAGMHEGGRHFTAVLLCSGETSLRRVENGFRF